MEPDGRSFIVDAALISLAHATGMPLLTFDRQMLSLYAK